MCGLEWLCNGLILCNGCEDLFFMLCTERLIHSCLQTQTWRILMARMQKQGMERYVLFFKHCIRSFLITEVFAN